jgi:RimJ/RimL family protein N-acetyltransferase
MKDEILKLYERYNEFAFYHFNKVKKFDVDRLIKDCRLLLVRADGQTVGAFETYIARSSVKIKCFQDIEIAHIEKGDRVIRKFTVNPYNMSPMVCRLLEYKEPTFLFIWEEDETAKRVAKATGFDKIGIKVASTAEIEGVYFRSTSGEGQRPARSTSGFNRMNEVGIARLDLPAFDVSSIAEKVIDLQFVNHYSNYNVGESWKALSLRGYGDPTMIEKPTSMPKKWREENRATSFELKDTALMAGFPELSHILGAIIGTKHRIRFMYLRGRDGELGRHTDLVGKEFGIEDGQVMRIHVPLVTNPLVSFSVWNWKAKKENWTMETGFAYYLDIRKPHAVKNTGDTDRVHLVIDVESSEPLRRLVFPDHEPIVLKRNPMVDTVMGIFKQYKETLGHIRRDYVERQVEAGNVVLEEGVVIIFGRYQKKTRLGNEHALVGDYILHQVANKTQGNGKAVEICKRFVRDRVGTADLWSCTRSDNHGSNKLMGRLGMEVVGDIYWSGGKIKGLVFRRDGLYHSIVGEDYVETNQGVQV